ncbi:hypothetical protein ZOSMA_451G00020 [Zostera marina]|uniref:Uncharacterized protein n=1 Tax=Zostera marina TaxID=29655 RepID=A0A0K9P2X3_ZOSMR|nr:hypothetical protein ZOSMA_451G00020 [Zostera marina]
MMFLIYQDHNQKLPRTLIILWS